MAASLAHERVIRAGALAGVAEPVEIMLDVHGDWAYLEITAEDSAHFTQEVLRLADLFAQISLR